MDRCTDTLNQPLRQVSSVKILNLRPFSKGALVAFFDVQLPSGLRLNGCQLLESNGKPWIGMPSNEWRKDDGSKGWNPVVEFTSQTARRNFQEAVLPAVLKELETAR